MTFRRSFYVPRRGQNFLQCQATECLIFVWWFHWPLFLAIWLCFGTNCVLLTVSSGDHTLCSAISCWAMFLWQLFTEQHSDTVLYAHPQYNMQHIWTDKKIWDQSLKTTQADLWENLKRWSLKWHIGAHEYSYITTVFCLYKNILAYITI